MGILMACLVLFVQDQNFFLHKAYMRNFLEKMLEGVSHHQIAERFGAKYKTYDDKV